MSKLQHALHALPPGSLISPRLYQSNREINALLGTQVQAEIATAKRVQCSSGCSWSNAIKAVPAP